MAKRIPFKVRDIERHEVPAYERRRAIAQEIPGRDLVLVDFGQVKTEVTFQTGLPVSGLDEAVYGSAPGGVRDTTVVGFLSGTSGIVLVDILTIDGRTMREKAWEDRVETLRLMHNSFPSKHAKLFPLAHVRARGLLKAFDEVVAKGRAGLLIRQPGKAQALLCTVENGRG